MKITMNTNEVSVCDGCSNWHICKFSEDVKRWCVLTDKEGNPVKDMEKEKCGLNSNIG